uniref:VWFA domain-containing protein n=1 Tax=Sander lucioperca TaxID=283035 RepID=A0A8C9XDI8_SANLU
RWLRSSDKTRFGLISYSDLPQHHFSLHDYDSRRKVLEALPKQKPTEGDTHTGEALQFSLQYFSAANGGRKALKVPQILMVITDGAATNPYILEEHSDALRANGIIVISVGVKEANIDQLETMAGGDKSKVFFVDNFKALETLYEKISPALCNTTKPGKSNGTQTCSFCSILYQHILTRNTSKTDACRSHTGVERVPFIQVGFHCGFALSRLAIVSNTTTCPQIKVGQYCVHD